MFHRRHRTTNGRWKGKKAISLQREKEGGEETAQLSSEKRRKSACPPVLRSSSKGEKKTTTQQKRGKSEKVGKGAKIQGQFRTQSRGNVGRKKAGKETLRTKRGEGNLSKKGREYLESKIILWPHGRSAPSHTEQNSITVIMSVPVRKGIDYSQ